MDVGDRLVQSVIRPVTREVTMPVEGKSDFSWSTYWATLISATVENAAPTHVVLTFPAAQSSLGASDFTIAGFTISSASWAGAVLTLILSRAVTYFDDAPIVTFVKTGGTVAVTNNVADDGATSMYNWITPVAKITKDGNNKVSSWASIIGALALGEATNQPTYTTDNGMRFGGTSTLFRITWGWNLPVSIFLVVRANSWTNEDIICAGASANFNYIRLKQETATPQVDFYNGASLTNTNLSLGVWHVVSILIAADGTASIQVDDNAAVTGNAGTTNPLGFSLGSRSDGYAKSDIDVLGFVLRNNADATKGALIKAALQNKLAFFLT